VPEVLGVIEPISDKKLVGGVKAGKPGRNREMGGMVLVQQGANLN
jgi:hypothetical protein